VWENVDKFNVKRGGFVCLFLPRHPPLVRTSSFTKFLDHTQRRTTVGRPPLDEWLARRRDLYLTTHNTHNRQTSITPVGFETTISAGERSQSYALDRAATGIGIRGGTEVRGWCAERIFGHKVDEVNRNKESYIMWSFIIDTLTWRPDTRNWYDGSRSTQGICYRPLKILFEEPVRKTPRVGLRNKYEVVFKMDHREIWWVWSVSMYLKKGACDGRLSTRYEKFIFQARPTTCRVVELQLSSEGAVCSMKFVYLFICFFFFLSRF